MNSRADLKTRFLLEDLQRSIEGEVLFDQLSRAIYSSGASLYRVRPLAIVKPKSRGDVVHVVEFAARQGIPITPRGSGTSRAGNEVGEGLLLDFTKYLNGVLEFNAVEK